MFFLIDLYPSFSLAYKSPLSSLPMRCVTSRLLMIQSPFFRQGYAIPAGSCVVPRNESSSWRNPQAFTSIHISLGQDKAERPDNARA